MLALCGRQQRSGCPEYIREQERRYIDETIKHNGGSREKAAKMLGISMATLYRKLEVRKTAAEARA